MTGGARDSDISLQPGKGPVLSLHAKPRGAARRPILASSEADTWAGGAGAVLANRKLRCTSIEPATLHPPISLIGCPSSDLGEPLAVCFNPKAEVAEHGNRGARTLKPCRTSFVPETTSPECNKRDQSQGKPAGQCMLSAGPLLPHISICD